LSRNYSIALEFQMVRAQYHASELCRLYDQLADIELRFTPARTGAALPHNTTTDSAIMA
jgi:hypothetical protein